MPRKQNQTKKDKKPKAPATPPRPAAPRNKAERHAANTARMDLRRETKFARHGIRLVETNLTEIRKGEPVNFKFVVETSNGPVGMTTTRRSALKRAHQHCHNMAAR